MTDVSQEVVVKQETNICVRQTSLCDVGSSLSPTSSSLDVEVRGLLPRVSDAETRSLQSSNSAMDVGLRWQPRVSELASRVMRTTQSIQQFSVASEEEGPLPVVGRLLRECVTPTPPPSSAAPGDQAPTVVLLPLTPAQSFSMTKSEACEAQTAQQAVHQLWDACVESISHTDGQTGEVVVGPHHECDSLTPPPLSCADSDPVAQTVHPTVLTPGRSFSMTNSESVEAHLAQQTADELWNACDRLSSEAGVETEHAADPTVVHSDGACASPQRSGNGGEAHIDPSLAIKRLLGSTVSLGDVSSQRLSTGPNAEQGEATQETELSLRPTGGSDLEEGGASGMCAVRPCRSESMCD